MYNIKHLGVYYEKANCSFFLSFFLSNLVFSQEFYYETQNPYPDCCKEGYKSRREAMFNKLVSSTLNEAVNEFYSNICPQLPKTEIQYECCKPYTDAELVMIKNNCLSSMISAYKNEDKNLRLDLTDEIERICERKVAHLEHSCSKSYKSGCYDKDAILYQLIFRSEDGEASSSYNVIFYSEEKNIKCSNKKDVVIYKGQKIINQQSVDSVSEFQNLCNKNGAAYDGGCKCNSGLYINPFFDKCE